VPRRFYDLYEGRELAAPRRSRLKPHGMPDIAWVRAPL